MGNSGGKRLPEGATQGVLNKGQAQIVLTGKDKAVLDLKIVACDIKKQGRILITSCDELLSRAKRILSESPMENKRALSLMKLRKYKLDQADKLEGQLLNVHKLIEEVEWAQINKELLSNLKSGALALKALNESMTFEKVEDILEAAKDAIEMERQISEMIGSVSLGEIDQQELEREFASMENSAVKAESFQGVGAVPLLPAAPVHPILYLPHDSVRAREENQASFM